MKKLMRLTAPALMLALVPSMGLAADYEPSLYPADMPVVDEYKPVEIGTGWYIRGDLGYSLNPGFDDRSGPYNPVAGTLGGQRTDGSSILNGSLGLGYRFTDYLRGDVELGYAHGNSFDARYTGRCFGEEVDTDDVTGVETGRRRASRNCAADDKGSSTTWTGMANAYVDLGTVAGFTPYVGGGLGLAYTTMSSVMAARACTNTTTTVPGTITEFTCDSPTQFGTRREDRAFSMSWAIAGGVAYDLTKNTKLDLGYRYLSMPGAKYVTHNGNSNVVKSNISSHQFKVGLRYEIW